MFLSVFIDNILPKIKQYKHIFLYSDTHRHTLTHFDIYFYVFLNNKTEKVAKECLLLSKDVNMKCGH